MRSSVRSAVRMWSSTTPAPGTAGPWPTSFPPMSNVLWPSPLSGASWSLSRLFARCSRKGTAPELAPQGIHVAHFVIDGAIRIAGRTEAPDRPDSMLDPDAIAASYLHVLRQPRSAWTWEIELRPWV